MTQEDSFISGAIDTVETTFTKGIAGTLFDIAKKVGGSSFQVIGDRRKAGKASKQYEEKYQSRYGLLKLLGMPQGVALESIYTPVRVLNELSIRQFESISNLEESYRDKNKRRFQWGECRTEDGITVANENQYLMVLGNPGGGKSTFLRRLGLEAFKGEAGKFKDKYIPVLLELKQFNTGKVDLIAAIAEEFTHFGFPPSKDFVTKALDEGKLLVLLDGLDEIPHQFTNSVMNAIDNLVTDYGYYSEEDRKKDQSIKKKKNRFIASCRIAAYRSDLRHDFKVIELADFDDDQIQQFITNWFSTDIDKQTNTADKCWESLNNENNKAAKELAQTPLLLTFLCLVYNRKQSFPPTRSRLYNKALDILLDEWAAEKRIQPEPIYEGLHTDLEKVMLAEIAHDGFKNDQLFFDEQKIVKSITDFLGDSVENPKYLDGKKILNAIAAQQGILVERAEDVYSFSHLTLQEYLTALYINGDDSLVQQLISHHLTDKRWREVFLLVAGLKNDASKFLLSMEKTTQELINTDKLHNLLVWVKNRTDNTSGDIQPVGKRAIALANAYAYSYANAYAYALSCNLALPCSFVYILANNNANPIANAYSLINPLTHTNPIYSKYDHAHPLYYGYDHTNPLYDPYTLFNAYKLSCTITRANSNNNAYAYAYALCDTLEMFINYTEWSKKYYLYQDVNYSQLIDELNELKHLIPDLEEALKVHEVFGKKVISTWLNAFHITSDMVDFSIPELKALDNYFYANLLMVECKKAAVRVSRKTWSEIESRMLMPFRDQT